MKHFPSSVATDEKNVHGPKLEKFGPNFLRTNGIGQQKSPKNTVVMKFV